MNCCRGILVALTCGLVSTAVTAADSGTLRIQVVDSEGAVMGGAHISIRPDGTGRRQPSRATSTTTLADQRGRLTTELEAGFFDVCVMADAFVPTCQKVRVVERDRKDITVRMMIDAAAIREISDTFPTR